MFFSKQEKMEFALGAVMAIGALISIITLL